MSIYLKNPHDIMAPMELPWEVGGSSGGDDGGGEIPQELQKQLQELNAWAEANEKEAREDAVAFWILKVPAILGSASSGIFAYFNLTLVALIVGLVAGVCVAIDGIHPRGMLRNSHLRAYHDIRILINKMIAAWRSRKSSANEQNVARRIIAENEPERQRIAAYIRDAEASLGFKR